MEKGFFGSLFDMNRDGRLDSLERGMDYMAFQNMIEDSEDEAEEEEEDIW